MRILWVTAQILPQIAELVNSKKSNFGGWVTTMLNQLKDIDEIELGVVMCANVKEVTSKKIDNITYYVIPMLDKNKDVLEVDCQSVIKRFNPDLLHIEGNEYSIQNKFSKIKNVTNLVSLQGILSGYEPYQHGQLPINEMMFSGKFSEMANGWTMFLKKRLFFDKRIDIERSTIENARNILGRTFWDRSHSYWINKNVNYFTCNRILRSSFYNQKWEYINCEKQSIFVGNGYAALKGLHFVIEAVNLLKEDYKDIKVYVAGVSHEPLNKTDFKKRVGYSNYVKNQIKKLNLDKHIIFTGELSEKDMRDRLLKSNVYVLPSLIENSPNTLGESMLMGVPSISAYAGGASQMAKDEEEVLFYRANDSKLLAWQIKRIFDSNDLANKLSKKSQMHALVTHDPQKNAESLIYAYKKILNSERVL